MSSTFSELVASVLLDHCREVASSEKYLIREVLGVSPISLYAAVAERASVDCAVAVGNGKTYTMYAVELPGRIRVIPYLVVDQEQASDDPNRGNRGFNGLLRDWFDRDVPEGETRVLVTFDAAPIETQTTAMEEGLQDALLTPERLLEHVEDQVSVASHAVRPLLQSVIRFAAQHIGPRNAEDIAAVARFARESAALGSVKDVGERLVSLPWCLRDPAIEIPTADRRLRDALRHRGQVDRWASSPEFDFDEEVRSHYKPELAARLIAERHLGRVRWERFTLSEVLAGVATGRDGPKPEKNALYPVKPAVAAGAGVQVVRQTGDADFGSAVLCAGRACELDVHLKRPLLDRETLHVVRYVAAADGFVRGPGAKYTREDAGDSEVVRVRADLEPLNCGWAFFEVVLTEGTTFVKRYLGKVGVAALLDAPVTDLPYERTCSTDPVRQQFLCEDEPEIEIRNPAGDVRAADVEHAAGEADSEQLDVRVNGTTITVPVGYEIEDPDAPKEEPGQVMSPEHAVLRVAAGENRPVAEITETRVSFVRGRAQVTVGSNDLHLQEMPELGTSRWKIEARILESPELTAYRLGTDGEIGADPRLEELAMDGLEPEFSNFLEARAGFFGAILAGRERTANASVLAADLADLDECGRYISAYQDLLARVPDGGNWRAEYERVLLVDSVAVANTTDAYLAPTNPISVALHRELQVSMRRWAGQPTAQLLEKDVELLSPRYAIPLLKIRDEWCESRHGAYPWRIYSPLASQKAAAPETFVPGFMARRIQAFLEVHEAYKDERRTLVLAFVNPRRGDHIKDALLKVLRDAERKRKTGLSVVPRFEVKLFTTSADYESAVGSGLDTFMGEAQETGAPTWIEQELMQRLTYTKERLPDYLTDSTAFAHIAFIENYFRPDRFQAYELDARPNCAFVKGMAADVARDVEIAPNEVVFTNGGWLGGETSAGRAISRLLARSLEVAAAAEGDSIQSGVARGLVTRVRKSELPQLYDRCVWVVHIDRHIGLELFYPQAQDARTPYILDHTDQENIQESGFDGITATAMVKPYLARIRSAFQPLAQMDESRSERMLRWLNVLSGRWAIELLRQSPTELRERLGAVVAFRFLAARERAFEETGVLSLVISLDELLRVTGKEGLALTEGWAQEFGLTGEASDDFLLARMPLDYQERPRIHGRLIEVKYTETSPPNDKAWRQIVATHKLLSMMFGDESMPGRLFRGRALSKIIQTYASRMRAYGLIAPDLVEEPSLRNALDAIGDGEFEFVMTSWRGGQALLGDFFSVEPNYAEPVFAGTYPDDPPEGTGRIGRVRLGQPLIDALIAENQVESQAGEYDLPVYEEAERHTPRQPMAEPAEPTTAPAEEGAPVSAEPEPGHEEPEATRPAEEPVSPVGGDEARGGGGGPAGELAQRFEVDMEELRAQADRLDQAFGRYTLSVEPFDASLTECGPNVLRFKTRMVKAGTIASIEARTRDLQRELGIQNAIYVGQDPPFVTVDVPRAERSVVSFDDVLPILERQSRSPGELPFVLGVGASGTVRVEDLAQMPHLLVAGSTGSGKSVFLNTIAASLAKYLPASRLELAVVDVKGLDFPQLATLPHLRGGKIVQDPEEAADMLEHLIGGEVQQRRAVLQEFGARQMIELYGIAPEERWPPQIVVMIDEYAQLLTASGRSKSQLEGVVQQYAQFARSFGIYLVLSTQRPSVDVITGKIKANLPARCVFQLPGFNDSRTVIDVGGAEKLLGSGDMLFYREGQLDRYQAAFTGPQDFEHFAAPE